MENINTKSVVATEGNQAVAAEINTGTKNILESDLSNEFKTNVEEEQRKRFEDQLVAEHSRINSLNRSPPLNATLQAFNRILENNEMKKQALIPNETELIAGKKRQRSPEEMMETKYTILCKQMCDIQQIVISLHDTAIGNTNTKVEIKKGVKELKRKIERMKTKMDDFEEYSND